MAITAGMVKELREMTGAGMMDCKKALAETNGDMEAAERGKVKMKNEKRNAEHPEKINPMCENCGKFGGECQGTTEKVWTGCIYKTPKK